MPSILNSDNGVSSGSAGLKESADSSGVLQLQTNGTAALTIDTSQNVGIGTTSPSAKLHVEGNSGITTQIIKSTASVAARINMQTTNDANGYLNYDTGTWKFFNDVAGTATERMRIDSSGNVLVTSAAGLGYGTGSGGTVTQATSKSTGVTLNKPTGQITMNGAALAAGATVGFIFSNSLISTSVDQVIVSLASIAGNYSVRAGNISAGQITIYIKNETAGSLSESPAINFSLIKGATA